MSRIIALVVLELALVAVVLLVLRGGGEDLDPTSIGRLTLTQSGAQVIARATVRNGELRLEQLTVDWGDGTTDTLPIHPPGSVWLAAADHSYADDRSYVVRLVAVLAGGSEVVRSQAREGVPAAPAASSSPSGAAGAPSTPTPAATAEPATPTAAPTPEPTPSPAAAAPPAATPESGSSPEPTPDATAEPTPAGNLAPIINILELEPTDEPLTVSLVVVAEDPDGQLAAVAVDWGDGSTDELLTTGGSLVLSHTYEAAGIYPVTAIALDALGLEASATAAATAR